MLVQVPIHARARGGHAAKRLRGRKAPAAGRGARGTVAAGANRPARPGRPQRCAKLRRGRRVHTHLDMAVCVLLRAAAVGPTRRQARLELGARRLARVPHARRDDVAHAHVGEARVSLAGARRSVGQRREFSRGPGLPVVGAVCCFGVASGLGRSQPNGLTASRPPRGRPRAPPGRAHLQYIRVAEGRKDGYLVRVLHHAALVAGAP
jgi:hypothetical protein